MLKKIGKHTLIAHLCHSRFREKTLNRMTRVVKCYAHHLSERLVIACQLAILFECPNKCRCVVEQFFIARLTFPELFRNDDTFRYVPNNALLMNELTMFIAFVYHPFFNPFDLTIFTDDAILIFIIISPVFPRPIKLGFNPISIFIKNEFPIVLERSYIKIFWFIPKQFDVIRHIVSGNIFR